jgi:hypothetical protein
MTLCGCINIATHPEIAPNVSRQIFGTIIWGSNKLNVTFPYCCNVLLNIQNKYPSNIAF